MAAAKKTKAKTEKPPLGNEIGGIVLVALGVLVLLSLVTYSELDPPGGSAVRVGNLIGIVGAHISFYLVLVLGRIASYLIPVLLGAWGVGLMRTADTRALAIRSGYFAAFAVIFCALVSIPFTVREDAARYGGMAGVLISSFLITYLKVWGAYIVVVTTLVALVLVTTEVKLHTVLEWFHQGYLWLHDTFTEGWAELKRNWREYQKERAARNREKRRLAREAKAAAQAEERERKRAEAEERAAQKEAEQQERDAQAAAEAEERRQRERERKEALERALEPGSGDEPSPAETAVAAVDGDDDVVIGEVAEADTLDREEVAKLQKEKAKEQKKYKYPPLDVLNEPKEGGERQSKEELLENARILEETLAEFGVQVEVLAVNPGPVITQYEVRPAPGIKVSRIVNLADDLAMKLRAKGIRIVAPIPGKGAVGIELPNKKPSIVYMHEVVSSEKFQDTKAIPLLGLGKDVSGNIVCERLDKMPHLLVAGATGAGKSVCINTIIASLMFRASPAELRFIMVDPKRLELSMYKEIPHLLHPVITEPKKVPDALEWAIREMDDRYKLLAQLSVRDLAGYNEKIKSMSKKELAEYFEDNPDKAGPLPFIVIIVDEFAEVMMATEGKAEEPICRLAQMSRAVGIHLILATQRPSVDVITGVIKANFPARIAFRVAQKNDSRTILDANGAESLLGNGDMLYTSAQHPKAVRYHGAFIRDEECEQLANFLRKQKIETEQLDLDQFKQEKMAAGGPGGDGERDELFNEAMKLVVTHQQGSISLVQRRLKVGYSRAARLIDELEMAGIVGPFDGSKARQVLVDESYLDEVGA